MMRTLAGVLFLFLFTLTAAAAPPQPFDVVSIDQARIAVPKEWRDLSVSMGKLLYRQGDGIGAIPMTDETGSPLQVGMSIERFAGVRGPLDQVALQLAEEGKGDPALEPVGKPKIETIKLADGTEARLLELQFIKESERRSLQMKLVAKDAQSSLWIVSAHIVGGKASEWPAIGSTMEEWLKAHVKSFVLDPTKFDAAAVAAGYAAPTE